MSLETVKANLLAENIKGFAEYVYRKYEEKNIHLCHPDQLYRLKSLVDEFQLSIIAEELLRINKYMYDEKYTAILVENFRKGITVIGEYIDQNEDGLFIFTSRLHTLRSMDGLFSS